MGRARGWVLALSCGAGCGPASEYTNVEDAVSQIAGRARCTEATGEVDRLYRATHAYFEAEHLTHAPVGHISPEPIRAAAPHVCPNDMRDAGSVGPVPPLEEDCNRGPGGRCAPRDPLGDAEIGFDPVRFVREQVWISLDFRWNRGHTFHYAFRWRNVHEGYGACQFTVFAFGDLDGDGTYSTYSRAGALAMDGASDLGWTVAEPWE